MKRLASLLLSSLLLACASVAPPAQPVHIVLAHTTDVHGNIEPRVEKTASGEELRSGGSGLLGGYLRNLRAANPNVVLLDSGDMWQGTLISNSWEGEPVVLAYNALGYDAAAVGNHEFDYGPLGPPASPQKPGDDPFGALRRNVATAKFPLLSSNIRFSSSEERPGWLRPFTIVEREGVRIGIIGATTEETPSTTLPLNVASLRFTAAAEEIAKTASMLREKERVDLVVVVAHIGTACKDVSNPQDASSCNASAELFPLVKALPAGSVDAVLAGHSHALVRHFVNGIAVAQAAPYGRGLSVIDFWLDAKTHRPLREKITIRPLVTLCERVFENGGCDKATGTGALRAAVFEGAEVHSDERVASTIAGYVAKVGEQKRAVMPFSFATKMPIAFHSEFALGSLIADAVRAAVPGADVGVVNSGGIRTEMPAGPLTFGEMFALLPFDNYVTRVRMTGAELGELFQRTTGTVNSILQVSGVKVTADTSTNPATITLRREDGAPIDPNAIYTVATVDFLTTGGEGLAPLMDRLPAGAIEKSDLLIRDAVIRYFEQLGKSGRPIEAPAAGRWTFVQK